MNEYKKILDKLEKLEKERNEYEKVGFFFVGMLMGFLPTAVYLLVKGIILLF